MPAGHDATENSCPALMPHVTANGDIDGHSPGRKHLAAGMLAVVCSAWWPPPVHGTLLFKQLAQNSSLKRAQLLLNCNRPKHAMQKTCLAPPLLPQVCPGRQACMAACCPLQVLLSPES